MQKVCRSGKFEKKIELEETLNKAPIRTRFTKKDLTAEIEIPETRKPEEEWYY